MTQSQYGPQTFFQFLKTATGGITPGFTTGGTGTGASTGSTHGGTITAGPATGKKWIVNSMRVLLGGAATGINSTKYGDSAALSVGAQVHLKSSTGNLYFLLGTTDLAIKDNGQWADFGEAQLHRWQALEKLSVLIDFPKAYGGAIELDGDKSEKVCIWFKESTTGVAHKYAIQGYEQSK